ncbi:hypothetical protein JNW90_33875 [Micromonospora sp. STR1s_5]|nr:hypothetical protein [Micromonospora sp. STR1s_5]
MELTEARALAAAAFEKLSGAARARQQQLDERKKERRRISDELKKFEDLWEELSPEAYGLILQAGSILGWPDPDIGALAGVARELSQGRSGRPALRSHRRAAEPLLEYWREVHGEPTRTLYMAGDARVKRPSAAVKWLGAELKLIDPILTHDQALTTAYTVLGALLKPNDPKRPV